MKPAPTSPQALQRSEIQKLVYKYIGVAGGYLGTFSYNSHAEFYAELDLLIDPAQYGTTTRERFINVLAKSPPATQARILEGVLARYPVGTGMLRDGMTEIVRTQELHDQIRGWIERLRGAAPVPAPTLRITSSVVERALRDAEELLRTSGATSGVDRAHTALHGYLRAVCASASIDASEDAGMPELLRALREKHAAFRSLGPRADDIMKVLRSLGTIIDALNPLRNKASVAHPNESLLAEPEAMLVINGARSILRYLDDRLHEYSKENGDDTPF